MEHCLKYFTTRYKSGFHSKSIAELVNDLKDEVECLGGWEIESMKRNQVNDQGLDKALRKRQRRVRGEILNLNNVSKKRFKTDEDGALKYVRHPFVPQVCSGLKITLINT